MARGIPTRREITPADVARWPNIYGDHGYTTGEVERFLAKIDIRGAEECWPWVSAAKSRTPQRPEGYGCLTREARGQRVSWYAHRFSLDLATPPDPDRPCACHSCDNTICANPRHLFRGTHADNTADMDAKGRRVKPRAIPVEMAKWAVDQVAAGRTAKAVADELGVSDSTVANICSGRTFPELGLAGDRPLCERPRPVKFTAAACEDIARRRQLGVPLAELAAEYGTGVWVICRIARGKYSSRAAGLAVAP